MSRKSKKPETDDIFKPYKVRPKSEGQREFMRSILHHTINFVTGPAGTGKTHLAVGMAVAALEAEEVDSIVLSRPLVGVGRDMGYLPGTMMEKVGPYVQPCFDELGAYISERGKTQLLYSKKLKVVPLSMMRGRTFHNAFVILDEAQNATKSELKTFLTRLGRQSKMVIAGDAIQMDLRGEDRGAFSEAMSRLGHLDMVSISRLGPEDIIRNPLIADILEHLW